MKTLSSAIIRSTVAGLLLILVAVPSTFAQGDEERINLDADGIRLSQAVQMIIRNRPVSLVTGEKLDQTVTAKFNGVAWRDALSSLLRVHGYSVVEEQSVLRIVPLKPSNEGPTPRAPLVLRFRHINAATARALLAPLLSGEGKIVALEDEIHGRSLSIVDTPENLEVIRNLVDQIDIPASERIGRLASHDDGTVSMRLENFPLIELPKLFQDALGLNTFVNVGEPTTMNASFERLEFRDGLRHLLRGQGLDFREDNGVLIIDRAEKLSAELITQEFELKYLDAWDVKEYLQPLLSENGKISCYSPRPRGGFEFGSKITDVRKADDQVRDNNRRSRVFAVTDRPRVLEQIAERVAELDVLPRQIEVCVKIVQITRDAQDQRGFDWNTVLSISGSRRPTNLPFGPHTGRFFPGPYPDPGSTNFLFGTLDASELTAAIRLIQQSTDAEIVSEPNITTMDAIEASILIGQKFPVTTETIDPQTAVRTVTLDYYEDIGIQLNVVPSVTGPDDRVHLIIHPAVSSVAEIVDERFPVIQTREADTQVLLRSGETVVIGGLIEHEEQEIQRRIPILGRIPLLGRLFRYDDKLDTRTELILLVTPRVILDDAELEKRLLVAPERLERLRGIDRAFGEVLDR
ncbi:MAG: type II secretion system protein GspD [Planctomycetes bacterium]|nr:type II secretion system protein GspD [Planctomycetota bacterium]